MQISIREYRPEDRPVLTKCIEELQFFIAGIDPVKRVLGAGKFDSGTYIDYTLSQVKKYDGKIFFAEVDGQTAGCIIGVIPDHSELDALESVVTRDGMILELIVLRQFRHFGVGTRLTETLEGYFKTKGCSGLHVNCFGPNESAYRFYTRQGYVDRTHVMLKLL